jgi:hypothetical protein
MMARQVGMAAAVATLRTTRAAVRQVVNRVAALPLVAARVVLAGTQAGTQETVVTPVALPAAGMPVATRAAISVEAALPEAVVLWVAAVTSAALATPATTKVLAMPVRARTGATSVAAPTAVAMLTTRAATVEAGATVVVIAATQEAPAIQAMTATWVVLARARMEAISGAARKGAVMPATEEAMAAAAVDGAERS